MPNQFIRFLCMISLVPLYPGLLFAAERAAAINDVAVVGAAEATQDEGYYVVLASRKNRSDAERALEKFSREVKFPLVVRRVTVKGAFWHRVTSPFFPDKQAVAEFMAGLPPALAADAWYLRTRVDVEGGVMAAPVNTAASPARVRQGEVEEPVLPVAAEKSPSASVWQDTGVSPLSGTVTETMAQPSFATDGEAVSAYPFEHFARLREEPVTADSDRSNHESPKHVAAPAAHAQPRTSDRQSQLPSSQSGTSKDESGDTTSAHQKANENYPFSEFGKLDSQGKEKSGDE